MAKTNTAPNNDKETLFITRKLTLIPRGDKAEVNRVYKYIRDGQELPTLKSL